MNRRDTLAALAALCAAPHALSQPAKARIGYLGTSSASEDATDMDALRAGLRELGYIEGRNIVFEFRWAEGKADRLPGLAAELVRLNVDMILTSGGPAVQAAMRATKTIPIVMTSAGDPVRSGFVASLARPGGNVTGLTQLGAELGGKRLELVKDVLPKASRVAFLWNPTNAGQVPYLKEMQAAAGALKLTLLPVEARSPRELDSAFAAMLKQRPDALVVTADTEHRLRLAWIVEFAAKHRLPVAYQLAEYVDAGGLMSYGTNRAALRRRAASYVDRILKGAKPADMAIEQPTKFDLVINRKTAKALGLAVPQAVLLRADRVID